MKKSGSWLTRYALEQVGVRYTFGIPGVHNTELYDELAKSELITPILVTHEGGASFMADAIGRTTDTLGCLAIVPAAGLTHAMSGIGEAYLDGVPMLVVSGGIRRDTGRSYQLHEFDQVAMARHITKGSFLIDAHEKVVPTIYEAARLATSGEPGPVFIELSGDLQMFTGEVGNLPVYEGPSAPPSASKGQLEAALELLRAAKRPGLYMGWGCRDATKDAVAVADKLGAPVSTTMQGLSVFPHDHPLHAGFGFGPSAVPAAQGAFAGCDCLLAVGVRFAELATGSYGMPIPEDLIHVDINPEVFDKNYPTKLAIEADAAEFFAALAQMLDDDEARESESLRAQIASDKAAYQRSWTEHPQAELVSPGIFFRDLRAALDRDAYVVVDDGNHTFLTAEQFPVYESRHLISPTDFNCMGYCVPATIGTKLSHPDKQVVGIVGDGCFMMTAMEILTATMNGLGAIFFVFHDGELAQISQFQSVPLKHKTCTVTGDLKIEGVAIATGASYLRMSHDGECKDVIEEALRQSGEGRPVIVDVNIDYSRKSTFTKGVVKVNLGRFPLSQKLRFLGRAAKRHLVG
jgi:acetolactate synthase-1/2/3 large subunit